MILIASVAVWFLQSFDVHMNMVTNAENSILAMSAGLISPIMNPIGLGDWRILVSLVTGFMAKESVVSTMEVLYSGGVAETMTSLTAASILVFSLLYTPCVAAIAAVKRELGNSWAIVVVVWQCVVAWIVTLLVRCICMLFGVV